MTVKDLKEKLKDAPEDKQVVVSRPVNSPWAVSIVEEIVISEEGPVYLRSEWKDR